MERVTVREIARRLHLTTAAVNTWLGRRHLTEMGYVVTIGSRGSKTYSQTYDWDEVARLRALMPKRPRFAFSGKATLESLQRLEKVLIETEHGDTRPLTAEEISRL